MKKNSEDEGWGPPPRFTGLFLIQNS